MAYENKHTFRDGAVVLYTRNGSSIYHMRLSVDGLAGYIALTTKQRSLDLARVVAENKLDDLRHNVRHGLEVGIHSFKTIWERWLKAQGVNLSTHRKRYILGTANRYFLPFFGKKTVGELNDALMAQYWTWRVNYWVTGDGVEKLAQVAKPARLVRRRPASKLGNVAKIPAQKTLDMERTTLGQVLGWAHRNGMINRLPEIKPPKVKTDHSVDRRPAFELEEWRKLYDFMRGWAKEGETVEGEAPRVGPHELHRWQRQLVRNYVLFMASSGLRPNEARQLRWRDVVEHKDENGALNVIIHVSPNTKTGQRQCIPLLYATKILDRIKEASFKTEPDDLIFCDRKGNPIENFGKTFQQLLIKSGLLKDRFGKNRTIYSLRHTYATFRIAYGKANVQFLARNMGTSPATIFKHYNHVTNIQMAHELGGQLHKDKSRKGLFF